MKNYNPFLKLIFTLSFVFLLLAPFQLVAQDTQAKKIIFETNMCLDVDDVGALAMIHALQNRGEAELLAVCLNEIHPNGAAAIDAINTWYGRGNIPVGVYRGPFTDPDSSAYLDDLTKFPHDLDGKNAPDALDVYRRVLVNQPDGSVTIISVGFLNNLGDLLKAEPELVAKKVNELVIMGSHLNDDHNLGFHSTAEAAQYVLEKWPSPLVFHHIGGDIMTGIRLQETPVENPVREAYYKFFGSSFKNRYSFDPITVLYGVRGADGYFNKNSDGRGSTPGGYTWELRTRGDSVLEALLPIETYARIIEDMMIEPPRISGEFQPQKIIYETNMGSSVDDVGALAMIHGLQNRGETELLAVCLNATGDPDGAAAIDAINTWYGRGDIPVGIWKGPFPDPDTSKYMHVLTLFPHNLDSKSAPAALEVYRKVLTNQPDKSVKIISTGYLQNLDELLRNEPNLVISKVKELVIMGAYQNDPEHFVLHNTEKAAQNVIKNWPTPIVFHLLGAEIMTGSGLKNTPVENPVRMAYYLQLGPSFPDNASWDQMTVLYGVRGTSGYFNRITDGTGMLVGGYKWDFNERNDSRLEMLLPVESYAKTFNALMSEPPIILPYLHPKKVIYETDMCADVDDVGGLAMLHAMADNKEAEILAVCFNEVNPYGAPAIDAINTWYGRGDIPVGIYKGSIEDPDDSRYLESVAQFPHDLETKNTPSALEVYQNVLSAQPDGSVTIISVGFVNNLGDLLRADPELVARKVKELVLMAGTTDGGGFNLNRHNLSSESEYIIRDWPTPIVFTDPGGRIFTGPGLEDSPVENPVREAYYKYFEDDFKKRPSWDQISVLYGVRGLSGYFTMETTGSGHLHNGFKYQIEPGYRTFVKAIIPDEAYARIIEDLMVRPPMKEKRVIYETNMCTSVDDVGALAMIHGLVNRGEAELLAVCYNEVHPGGAAAIDAINTWYGRGDIPVGVYKDDFPDPGKSKFLDALKKFPHDLDAEKAESALDVYRRVLANQPDGSVTIISVGFLNNLYDLLKEEPDLVSKKVNELVIMGAIKDDALHFVAHDLVNTSQYVLENWPTPVAFHHLGGNIMTGSKLKQTPVENPVREAYYAFFDSNFRRWSSYDPMTVFYGIKGYPGYFTKHATGTGSLPNGFKWDLISHNHSDIKMLLPPEAYARIIDELMADPPLTKR